MSQDCETEEAERYYCFHCRCWHVGVAEYVDDAGNSFCAEAMDYLFKKGGEGMKAKAKWRMLKDGEIRRKGDEFYGETTRKWYLIPEWAIGRPLLKREYRLKHRRRVRSNKNP